MKRTHTLVMLVPWLLIVATCGSGLVKFFVVGCRVHVVGLRRPG